jgi:lipopolysaccharide/colanic/teichoic acid biosynthesis glycosyltransferase
LKNHIERFIAFILLLVTIPFLLILSILIVIIDNFFPFYTQERIGKDGSLFTCYKLQTMIPAKSKSVIGERELDRNRFTKLGSFIRDRGWDEIPQLINIILGKMSFIGPRPLLQKTVQKIEAKNQFMKDEILLWKQNREKFLPGISGWHQIHIKHYRSIIICDEEYIQNPSFRKRVKIFFVTSCVFLLGKNFFK